MVLQVLTARAESNSLLESIQGKHIMKRRSDGATGPAAGFFGKLLKEKNTDLVRKLVRENRRSWIENYQKLLESVEVPVILFWFSQRDPDYKINYKNNKGVWGEYPQLIDKNTVDQIKIFSDEWVECVSTRGMPQLLVSRFTSNPVSPAVGTFIGNTTTTIEGKVYNKFYPSPEMHIDAAEVLESVCKKYLSNKSAMQSI